MRHAAIDLRQRIIETQSDELNSKYELNPRGGGSFETAEAWLWLKYREDQEADLDAAFPDWRANPQFTAVVEYLFSERFRLRITCYGIIEIFAPMRGMKPEGFDRISGEIKNQFFTFVQHVVKILQGHKLIGDDFEYERHLAAFGREPEAEIIRVVEETAANLYSGAMRLGIDTFSKVSDLLASWRGRLSVTLIPFRLSKLAQSWTFTKASAATKRSIVAWNAGVLWHALPAQRDAIDTVVGSRSTFIEAELRDIEMWMDHLLRLPTRIWTSLSVTLALVGLGLAASAFVWTGIGEHREWVVTVIGILLVAVPFVRFVQTTRSELNATRDAMDFLVELYHCGTRD